MAGSSTPGFELVGVDDQGRELRLAWSDRSGWTVQRESSPGQWIDLGVYSAEPPIQALPFARWLLGVTDLHHDIIEDFVKSIRDAYPGRFNQPDSGEAENVTAIHARPPAT
jgi:hypothetical protein